MHDIPQTRSVATAKSPHTSGRSQVCLWTIQNVLDWTILSCSPTTTRGQQRSRNFMPRIHGGLKASSLPRRQWAGEPHSWCMSTGCGWDGQGAKVGCGACHTVYDTETQTLDWPDPSGSQLTRLCFTWANMRNSSSAHTRLQPALPSWWQPRR